MLNFHMILKPLLILAFFIQSFSEKNIQFRLLKKL